MTSFAARWRAVFAEIVAIARQKSLVVVPFTGTVRDPQAAAWLDASLPARFGRSPASFVPEHGDVLVVVGDVSHKLAPILVRTHAALSAPGFVVHVTAAPPGAPVGYGAVAALDEVLPVDVVVKGCPPDDDTLARAIRALERLVRERHVRAGEGAA